MPPIRCIVILPIEKYKLLSCADVVDTKFFVGVIRCKRRK